MPDQEHSPQKSVDQRIDDFISALQAEAKVRAEADAAFSARLAEAHAEFSAQLADERKARAEAEADALRRHAEADARLTRLEMRSEAHSMNLELLTVEIQQTSRKIDKLAESVDALTASMEIIRQLQPILVDLLRSHDARISKLEQR